MWKVGNTVVTREMADEIHDKAVNMEMSIGSLIELAISQGAEPEDAGEIVKQVLDY